MVDHADLRSKKSPIASDFMESSFDEMSNKLRGDVFAEYASIVGILYALSDLVAVLVAAVMSYYIRFGSFAAPTAYRAAIVFSLLLVLVYFPLLRLYHSWRGRAFFDYAGATALAWSGVIVTMVVMGFVLKVSDLYSREWLLMFAGIGLFLLLVVRTSAMAILRSLRRNGWNHKRIVIVGGGDWSAEIVHRVSTAKWLGMDIIGVFDHDDDFAGRNLDGIEVQPGYEQLPDVVEKEKADEVWICLPMFSTRFDAMREIDRVRRILRHSTVTQRLVPKISDIRLINQPVTEIMGQPVINLNTSPMHGLNRLIKDAEDRILGLILLLISTPVMLLIAVGIKLDSPGPVLFKQRRHGYDGKPINVYKFRTMQVHGEDGGNVTQASRDDARVTRLGKFLRRSSLDELPQFFNVLQGKMSIVGPRPHAISHNEFYQERIDFYMQRHKVKPGITGWAQVNGLRGETDQLYKMQRRVDYDLFYIENWSLLFDLRIILLTLIKGFVNKNAF